MEITAMEQIVKTSTQLGPSELGNFFLILLIFSIGKVIGHLLAPISSLEYKLKELIKNTWP